MLNSLGEVYARLGDWAAAERTFKEGIEIFHGAGPYCGESAMLHNLGAMLEKHGRSAEALTTYLGAINVLEECRWHDGDLSLRAGFAEPGEDVYQAAVKLLMRANRPKEAFGVVERSRVAAFPGAPSAPATAEESSLFEERDFLWLERCALRDKLSVELGRGTPKTPAVQELERDFSATDLRYADVVRQIANGPSGFRQPAGTRSGLGADQLEASVPEDTALLSYFEAGNSIYGFAVRRRMFLGFEVAGAAPEIAHLIAAVPGGSLSVSRDALRRLYQALVGPARKIAEAPTIVVEASGALRNLPFGALLNQETYLIEEHQIFSVTNAGALVSFPKAEEGGHGLFVAAPAGDAQGADVYSSWYANVPPVTHSNAASLRLLAPRSGVLHVASPIVMDSRSPLLSRILLSPTAGPETNIDLGQVLDLNLRRVNLVVLGAPEPGQLDGDPGDDIGVLVRSFAQAGAATVVSRLWPVPADAQQTLLNAFYQRLRAGQGKAAALRLAQLRVREAYPWPGIWAAFDLTGDPGALKESAAPSTSETHISGIIADVNWPYFTVDTKDHSRIRIRFQSHTDLQSADKDAPPAALKPGATVLVTAGIDADASFHADDINVLASNAGASMPEAAALIETSNDPVLRAAVSSADTAIEKLPNFTSRQVTSRAVSADDGLTWTHTDTISADVVYSANHEVYLNIQQGVRAWQRGIMDLDGLTSSGEYGTVLRNLFRSSTGARFQFLNTETQNGRPVFVYDYWIPEATGDWFLSEYGHQLKPAYHGRVWIDKVNLFVWKIRQVADQELPADFPWRRAESEVVFDLMEMKDGAASMLPRTGTTITCDRGKVICNQNNLEFREYKRYQATSVMKAESGEPKAPVMSVATPESGTLIWKGALGPDQILEIRNGQSNVGAVGGAPFPGGEIEVSIEGNPKLIDRPSEKNGWGRIVVKNGDKTVKQIEIHWRLNKK